MNILSISLIEFSDFVSSYSSGKFIKIQSSHYGQSDKFCFEDAKEFLQKDSISIHQAGTDIEKKEEGISMANSFSRSSCRLSRRRVLSLPSTTNKLWLPFPVSSSRGAFFAHSSLSKNSDKRG